MLTIFGRLAAFVRDVQSAQWRVYEDDIFLGVIAASSKVIAEEKVRVFFGIPSTSKVQLERIK